MKWKVQVLKEQQGSEYNGELDDFEISVLHKDGEQAWGWGCENKIILFSSCGDNILNPGTKEQFEFAEKVAQILCNSLNKLQIKPPSL